MSKVNDVRVRYFLESIEETRATLSAGYPDLQPAEALKLATDITLAAKLHRALESNTAALYATTEDDHK
jgi:ribosomal protein RSM22 (predicted rRNA methylase)